MNLNHAPLRPEATARPAEPQQLPWSETRALNLCIMHSDWLLPQKMATNQKASKRD